MWALQVEVLKIIGTSLFFKTFCFDVFYIKIEKF